MWERILTRLASLRVRLIATYVLVTAIPFFIVTGLLVGVSERYLIYRETLGLKGIADTLASTIRTPWRYGTDIWLQDQYWTQKRCYEQAPILGNNVRIRMLDPSGKVLTDSRGPHDQKSWLWARRNYPNLRHRPEVKLAMSGQYSTYKRRDEGNLRGLPSIYIAEPVLRTDARVNKQRVAFIMYVSEPVAPIHQGLQTLLTLVGLGLGASLLITILVSLVLSAYLSSNLRAATQVAQEFAAGQMDLRMREDGRDEVGQLGKAFNQMADAIQRHEQLRRELLADVSHELRTPLTAISGCADTLLDNALRDDPEASERFLAIIQRESERLQRLVSDILELSKLQAGAVSIPLSPISLKPLVDEAVEIARLHAATEGIRIDCHYPEELISTDILVQGNEDRLAQALRNLLDNARHHSTAGKHIIVGVEVADSSAVIHIRDEGKGITPEDLPLVFDRFYRAGTGGSSTGTGLGLAIVREIMSAHGGAVRVDSTLGEGTTFSLHLPRVELKRDEG
ncbi:MAG: sensor histidine kinase [Armatimonadota bacterium]